MAKILTTDNLVTSLKRRAMIPTDAATFTKTDLIAILNEEVDVGLVPYLLSVHEEYLVYTVDESFTATGQQTFKIPERAIGNKLRGAAIVDSAGNLLNLTKVEIDELDIFQNEYDNFGDEYTYYVKNDSIIVTSTAGITGSLRMYFYMTPSELVEDKFGAVIQSINTTTGEIVVDKIPSTFTNGASYDFTKNKSPNIILNYDKVAAINTATKVITFNTTDIPSNLVVGDYITLAGESIVPHLPRELHPILAQRAAIHCLHALGDDRVQMAEAKLVQMERNVIDLIDNRVETSTQKIANFNSPLRQTRKYTVKD